MILPRELLREFVHAFLSSQQVSSCFGALSSLASLILGLLLLVLALLIGRRCSPRGTLGFLLLLFLRLLLLLESPLFLFESLGFFGFGGCHELLLLVLNGIFN